jgi:hypothetical protein
MSVLSSERPIKRGMIRGRESRNQTLTTKVTETEQRAVEDAASTDAKTTGEWLRDLALRTLRSGTSDVEIVALSEIVGVRLLLVNVLRSLGTGEKLRSEAFDKLVDEIATAKYEVAAKLVAERRR